MKINEKWKTNETQEARGAEHKQRGANRRDGAENKADGRSATSVSGLEQGRREGKRERGNLGSREGLGGRIQGCCSLDRLYMTSIVPTIHLARGYT
jgi:hypothetical protein